MYFIHFCKPSKYISFVSIPKDTTFVGAEKYLDPVSKVQKPGTTVPWVH